MTLRLALFDFDGTLADSGQAIVDIFFVAFANAGLPSPQPSDIRATIGLPLHLAVGRLYPDLADTHVADVVELYIAEYTARHAPGQPSISPLFTGALEAMAEMEKAMLLGIATGKSRNGLSLSLNSLGLEDRFMIKKTADDGPAKPSPAIVLAAMAETGADPANTLVIGDTVFDIEMAKAAGVAAVGVSWGLHPADDLEAAGADRLITSFDELPELALELTGI